MSIRKYIAYLKTIETGSITHAAAQLGYTQSAISRMIADLEDSWGVKLLTRNRSGIEISSEGLTLLPKLQAICKDYEDLNYAISELHGLSSGSIRLGAFSSISAGGCPRSSSPSTSSILTSTFSWSTGSTIKSPPGCERGWWTAAL